MICIVLSGFSFDLYIGSKLMYSSADLENTMSWSSFVSFMENYARMMGIDNLSSGEIGDFQYLVWNGHTIGFAKGSDVFVIDGITVKSRTVPLVNIFSAFQLPFIQQESKIVLADMIISKITQTGDIIEITYSGSDELEFARKQDRIEVISNGFVAMNNQIYKPGELLWTISTDKKIDQKVSMPGLIRLILAQENFVADGVVTLKFEQTLQIPDSGVLLFYAKGDDRIIIRPYSPDFEGSDWPVYAQNKKIAQQIAARFNLKLEICPLYNLPVTRIAMVVLLSDEARVSEIEDYLRELLF